MQALYACLLTLPLTPLRPGSALLRPAAAGGNASPRTVFPQPGHVRQCITNLPCPMLPHPSHQRHQKALYRMARSPHSDNKQTELIAQMAIRERAGIFNLASPSGISERGIISGILGNNDIFSADRPAIWQRRSSVGVRKHIYNDLRRE